MIRWLGLSKTLAMVILIGVTWNEEKKKIKKPFCQKFSG